MEAAIEVTFKSEEERSTFLNGLQRLLYPDPKRWAFLRGFTHYHPNITGIVGIHVIDETWPVTTKCIFVMED
jgi:hypothetical protein